MNHKTAFIAGGASLVSAAAGVAGGYFLAVKRLRAGFDEELKAQLAAAENVFKMKHKVGMYRSPIDMVSGTVEEVVPAEGQSEEQLAAHAAMYDTRSDVTDDQLGKIIENLQKPEVGGRPGKPISGSPVNGRRKVVEAPPSILGLAEDLAEATADVNHNVFDDEDWPNYSDYIAENPRTKDEPYVITMTEWSTCDAGYDQVSVVWWDEDGEEGMGVLSDAQDMPIEDVDAVVGEKNMEKFGMWSGSSVTVFIRNERLRTDFEVNRHRGSYAEAMGLKIKPRQKRTPARRGADE